MTSSPKPISPKNSFNWSPCISWHGIGLEKMPKDQRNRFWKIIVLNLMTFFLDYTLILWGEIWYLSPLGLDVLNNTSLYTVSPCSTLQTPKEVLWMDQLSSHFLCFLLLQCLLREKKEEIHCNNLMDKKQTFSLETGVRLPWLFMKTKIQTNSWDKFAFVALCLSALTTPQCDIRRWARQSTIFPKFQVANCNRPFHGFFNF